MSSRVSGNVVVNDKGTKVFADDSTTICGVTFITIPSLSGCGVMNVDLFVAGVNQGAVAVVVRTTDTNADGRVTSGDTNSPCDLNYDHFSNIVDAGIVNIHADHWRRNALHGTLVRRTNYCETCPEGAVNTRGGSILSWSPSQRFNAHTAFVDAAPSTAPTA